MRSIIIALTCFGLMGCMGQGRWGQDVGWPSSATLGQSAAASVQNPAVWLPIVTAGALWITNKDEPWSKSIQEDQSVFGSNAEDDSDDLLHITFGAHLLTTAMAPSPTFEDKLKGMGVALSTVLVDGAVSEGLKDVLRRERPNGTNRQSTPSGHAQAASTFSAFASRNLTYIDMPQWVRHSVTVTLHSCALGTALARVEANKHHLADVLLGYGIGQFLGNFMHRAFLETGHQPRVGLVPIENGLALRLFLPLR